MDMSVGAVLGGSRDISRRVQRHSNVPCIAPVAVSSTFDNIEVRHLDHLGLIAQAVDELKIAERSDRLLNGERARQRISMGIRVKAMITNFLAFGNRTLYGTSAFFEPQAVEVLLGERVTPDALNDDALGDCLDAIYAYGTSRFFESLSLDIFSEKKLHGRTFRLDSTSLSVEGDYPNSESRQKSDKTKKRDLRDKPKTDKDERDTIRVTFGHSKDKRPDLKQVMLAMVTTGPGNLPFLAIPQDGNASDKVEFKKILNEIQRRVLVPEGSVLAADSALYQKEWLKEQRGVDDGGLVWVTRVPESINEAKQLVAKRDCEWQTLSDGYRACVVSSDYGTLSQRWCLYASDQAIERETKTLEKCIAKEYEALQKSLWHLSNKAFSCEKDAEKAAANLLRGSRYHRIDGLTCSAKKRYASTGRPKRGQSASGVDYFVHGAIVQDRDAVARSRATLGRFILATNDTAGRSMADAGEVLSRYKELNGTEQGFRFLKDKTFLIDNFYVKKEGRLEALLVLMVLSLLVYGYLEMVVKERLKDADITLPRPDKRQMKTNTLRRVFEIFGGVAALRVGPKHCPYVIARLTPLQISILRALGPPFMMRYGIAIE